MMTADELRMLVGKECLRLALLGGANEIAFDLAKRGIKGTHDGDSCPLACGLVDALKIDKSLIWVTRHEVRSTRGIAPKQPRSEGEVLVSFRETMLPLADFVYQFDAGQHPHLQR